jgi:ADP-ribose pyrophosphatase YjhB (NUDIX family)
VYGAAGALLTHPDGRVLLVKPNYRDHWAIPGGMLEDREPPHVGCVREIREELGLAISPGPLLVVDWAPPADKRPRPLMIFVFDGGMLTDTDDITLQTEELDDYRFIAPDQVSSYLPASIAARIPAALTARATRTTVYLPTN